MLRLRVPAAGASAALRRAPCCAGRWAPDSSAALGAGRRGFATRKAAHVKHTEKSTTMPVLLRQDCHLGREGDEVQVSPGYMRNYLYERKIAVYSTSQNRREHYVERSAQDRSAFLRPQKIAASLNNTPLVRPTRAAPAALRLSLRLTLRRVVHSGHVSPCRGRPAAAKERGDG